MVPPFASVLIPTRERPDLLLSSIVSLTENATIPEMVELLFYVDDDDPTDYSWFDSIGRLFRGPRHYYVGLHHCYNLLAKEARGVWCLLWNDDSLMKTKGWDNVLREISFPPTNPRGLSVACTESNHGRSPVTFPIFTKSLVDALGHVSLNCHNDTWIEEVSKACGIQVPVPIKILRRPAEPKGPNTEGSHDYYSEENARLRGKDVKTLIDLMHA